MRTCLVLVLVVAACSGTARSRDGGDDGVGAPCHGGTECAAELDCAGVNDPQVCGIPPREGCASDADCGADRCHAIDDPCSPDGIGSECRSPCDVIDGSCGPGFTCDAGACVAIRCDAGFACAGREVCDPSRITAATPVFDRNHACFPVTCTDDAACNGRFCVNGTCQDALGSCQIPVAVP
jgi:hypothetical protein